jgi:hypothetical protein
MLLDVTEAQLATAKDSLQNLRDLVPRVQKESYKAGFSKGRHGLGAYVGYSIVINGYDAGIGYVIRF